jgi:hypothetical protein
MAGGFAVASAQRTRTNDFAGGLILGMGVAAMHYTGMSAFVTQGFVQWEQATIALSVLAGVVGAAGALQLAGRARSLLKQAGRRRRPDARRLRPALHRHGRDHHRSRPVDQRARPDAVGRDPDPGRDLDHRHDHPGRPGRGGHRVLDQPLGPGPHPPPGQRRLRRHRGGPGRPHQRRQRRLLRTGRRRAGRPAAHAAVRPADLRQRRPHPRGRAARRGAAARRRRPRDPGRGVLAPDGRRRPRRPRA